jgi:hypothetical protein
MKIHRPGRRILRNSFLKRNPCIRQPGWTNCALPTITTRCQSTSDVRKDPQDPEYSKYYACSNPRFRNVQINSLCLTVAFNLSGAKDLDIRTSKSWPSPDFFEFDDQGFVLRSSSKRAAMRLAYLRPKWEFSELADQMNPGKEEDKKFFRDVMPRMRHHNKLTPVAKPRLIFSASRQTWLYMYD